MDHEHTLSFVGQGEFLSVAGLFRKRLFGSEEDDQTDEESHEDDQGLGRIGGRPMRDLPE